MPDGGTLKLGLIFLQEIYSFNNFLGKLQVVRVGVFKNIHDHRIFLRQKSKQNKVWGQCVLMQVDHFHGAYIEGLNHSVCKIANMLL